MEHYKQKYGKVKGSMKLEHKAGHELFIDYAGKKLQIVDRETGQVDNLIRFVPPFPEWFVPLIPVQIVPLFERAQF